MANGIGVAAANYSDFTAIEIWNVELCHVKHYYVKDVDVLSFVFKSVCLMNRTEAFTSLTSFYDIPLVLISNIKTSDTKKKTMITEYKTVTRLLSC